jgi:hypothetical protein
VFDGYSPEEAKVQKPAAIFSISDVILKKEYK